MLFSRGALFLFVDAIFAFGQGSLAETERELLANRASCQASACRGLPAILNNLGGLYYETGRYREAEPVLKQAVDLLTESEADDELLTVALSNLAAVDHVRGRTEEAKALYRRARSLLALNGNTGLAMNRLLVKMALLARDTGDLTGAGELIQRAIGAYVTQSAIETTDGAAALSAWAAILESQGNLEQAEVELKRVLEIRGRLVGPDDMVVADALNTLGISYSHRKRWMDAERSLKRAATVARMYPPSPVLAASMNNLGSVLRAQGRTEEGEDWIRKAIDVWEKLLGPNHPNVAAGLTNLAVSLEARGHYGEAAPLLDRAYSIDKFNFVADDARIGIDLSRAGVLAKLRKRYPEAEDILRRATAILQAALPPEHEEIGAALLNLADVLRMEKKFEQAAGMYNRGLTILDAAWGPQDSRLSAWLRGYASVLRSQKDFEHAAMLEAQAARIATNQIDR